MTRSALLSVGLLAALAPSAARTIAETRPAAEDKLLGPWTGVGPCDGELILRDDGTFERRRYSPAGISVSGDWSVQWDNLPPLLTLAVTKSDDADAVDKTTQVKLVELNDRVLVYRHGGNAIRYKRANGDPVGTWKVTRIWTPGSPGETRDEFTLVIRRDGEQLKGRLIFPEIESSIDGPEFDVKIAYKDGTLSFRFGRSHIGDYSGRVTGDAIEGTMAVFLLTGRWEAKRLADAQDEE